MFLLCYPFASFSHSVVFWFGDLNFRIEDYDIHVVKCAIDSNKLPLLWERDQVGRLSNRGRLRLLFSTSTSRGASSSPSVPHSSTWLKSQSLSLKASMRVSSNSPRPISLTWAPTPMTPGLSCIHPPEAQVAWFISNNGTLLLFPPPPHPPCQC